MRTVLAPVDFSSVSRAVVTEATALAQAIGARLVLLHVVAAPPPVGIDFGVLETRAAAVESETAGRKLADLQRELQAQGVTAHTIHLVHEPGSGIVDEAVRFDADYIVMGSHGHTAVYDLIVGSTASHVLKRAPCPVVILPSGVGGPGKPRRRDAARGR